MDAWLMLVKGDDRQHGGNLGYEDELGESYVWDNTVPNHRLPQPGHGVAIWDGNGLVGASVIEEIVESSSKKLILHCPKCGSTKIKPRKAKVPEYRCYSQTCRKEFEKSAIDIEEINVTGYVASYSGAWQDLSGRISAQNLRTACEYPKAQHSIRRLRWEKFTDLLEDYEAAQLERYARLRCESAPKGGHSRRLTRVRLGQAEFRRRLVEKFGSSCAVSGRCPVDALEAAHLYSFARLGEHVEGGGLLLRRDIHRLFDKGLIAIEPESSLVDVARFLRDFPQYGSLHATTVNADLGKKERRWLKLHWEEHRPNADIS